MTHETFESENRCSECNKLLIVSMSDCGEFWACCRTGHGFVTRGDSDEKACENFLTILGMIKK